LLDLDSTITTESSLYIIDYQQVHPCKLLGPKKSTTFIGTPLYASISAHECTELGYASDIESLCYVLEHIYSGSLPWMNMVSLEEISVSKKNFSSTNKDIEKLFKFSQHASQSVLPSSEQDFPHLFEI
jgi:hypothetical protein